MYASRSSRCSLYASQIWLSLCTLLVGLMVAVGGLTRLTESGLSIVEWKPVAGILQTVTDAQWRNEFYSLPVIYAS